MIVRIRSKSLHTALHVEFVRTRTCVNFGQLALLCLYSCSNFAEIATEGFHVGWATVDTRLELCDGLAMCLQCIAMLIHTRLDIKNRVFLRHQTEVLILDVCLVVE